MINYKIAIPSYKRPETIKKKTLRLLDEYGIDKNRITVFVANTDEECEYKKSLGTEYKIVVGVPTIGKQRNFIERYYNEGTYLMMFDDDIDSVMRKDDNKLKPINDLYTDVIQKGFNECLKNNCNVFGIYAASNPYFMEDRIYTKICYIIASMFGVIIQHDKYLERQTNHGEDYEYSIRQYIKNGAVVRIDYITVKSNYYKEPGGLQEIRTKQYVYDSIKWIEDNFSDYCTMYIRKSSGNAELRLKDKTGNKNQIKLF